MNNKKGPLSGLRVMDFGHYYAGPMAATLLADQGADVIKVMKPIEGELEKGVNQHQFNLLNRNKQIVYLDLKCSDDLAKAYALIEKSDVVIENFRPGVMNRLGLGYDELRQVNPNLVLLSLPGFSASDKKRSGIKAWEGILSAAAGIYTEMSWSRQLLGFPPAYSSIPLCSAFGAVQGSIAVMAALIAREEKGCGGTVIEVPLVAAGLSGLSWHFTLDHDWEFRDVNKRKANIPPHLQNYEFSKADTPEVSDEKLQLSMAKMMPSPFGAFYTCADGRQILVWVVGSARYVERLLTRLDLYKQLLSEGFTNEGPLVKGLGNNLSGDDLKAEHRDRITGILKSEFLRKDAKHWENLLGDLGVIMVRTRNEWLSTEEMVSSGVFSEMTSDEEKLVVPGRIADVGNCEGKTFDLDLSQPVTASYDQVLSGWIKSSSHKSTKIKCGALTKGQLLSGLRVLDLSNALAGPLAAYTLAQYGADVIKADPPGPAHHLPGLMKGMLELTQGKKSILTDVKTAAGRKVFNRLIDWSDIVMHNILDDTAERLGIRQNQLQEIKAGVIGAQLTGFGGTRRGGWELRPANDLLSQAPTGMLTSYGTPENPQGFGKMTCGDSFGGLGLAFAALLSVWQKLQTGSAGEARSSMVRMVNYVQYPFMYSFNGQLNAQVSQSQFQNRNNNFQGIYECDSDWIYIHAEQNQIALLKMLVASSENATKEELEESFKKKAGNYWVDLLTEHSIASHFVETISSICKRELTYIDNGSLDETIDGTFLALCRKDHPCGTPVIFAAPVWTRVGKDRTWRRLSVGPWLGENTEEVLQNLGFSEYEIARMLKLKISLDCLPQIGKYNYM